MIIQIRGTSGSGKTTVVRRVVDALGGFSEFVPRFRDSPRSKSPIYYVDQKRRVAVAGSYENLCGGVDRLQAMGGYSLVQQVASDCKEYSVTLMEGLLLSEDVKQSMLMPEFVTAAKVLFLTTDVSLCIDRVNERRKLHNRSKPLNTVLLANRARTIERARLRLSSAGVYCRRASADQAVDIVLKWISQAAR